MNAQTVVDSLNEIFAVCPAHLHTILFNRVPATQEMVDHPKILCGGIGALAGQQSISFSGLGLINTLLHGTGELAAVTFKDGKMVGFQVVKDAGVTEGVLGVHI